MHFHGRSLIDGELFSISSSSRHLYLLTSDSRSSIIMWDSSIGMIDALL